jgi:hypothetical protein
MKASYMEDAWLVFKILTEPTPAVDFLLKSGNFGVGRHCTSQRRYGRQFYTAINILEYRIKSIICRSVISLRRSIH